LRSVQATGRDADRKFDHTFVIKTQSGQVERRGRGGLTCLLAWPATKSWLACRSTDTLRRSTDEGPDAHDSSLQTHKHTASETAVRHALVTGVAGLSAATWVSSARCLCLSMF